MSYNNKTDEIILRHSAVRGKTIRRIWHANTAHSVGRVDCMVECHYCAVMVTSPFTHSLNCSAERRQFSSDIVALPAASSTVTAITNNHPSLDCQASVSTENTFLGLLLHRPTQYSWHLNHATRYYFQL